MKIVVEGNSIAEIQQALGLAGQPASTPAAVSIPAPTRPVSGVTIASLRQMFDAARVVLRDSRLEGCTDTTKAQRNALRRAMRQVKAEAGPKGTLSNDNT